MAVLLGDVATAGWRLGAPKQVGELTIHPIEGEPLIQLLPKSAIAECTTPFAPKAFGDEPRRGIVFAVSEAVAAAWERIEAWAVRETNAPDWASCLRDYDTFRGLKAKVEVDRVQVVDLEGQTQGFPERWDSCVVPILQVRGVYQRGATFGLLVIVVALLVGPLRRPQLTFV